MNVLYHPGLHQTPTCYSAYFRHGFSFPLVLHTSSTVCGCRSSRTCERKMTSRSGWRMAQHDTLFENPRTTPGPDCFDHSNYPMRSIELQILDNRCSNLSCCSKVQRVSPDDLVSQLHILDWQQCSDRRGKTDRLVCHTAALYLSPFQTCR